MQTCQDMSKATEATTSITATAGDEEWAVDNNVYQSLIDTAKLREFNFTKDIKHLLLQAVCEHDAHRTDEYFAKVKDTLMQNMSTVT